LSSRFSSLGIAITLALLWFASTVNARCLDVALQALLGCGKTLTSKITRKEFLHFGRRSPEVRSWVSFYDDSIDDMDRADKGGGAGGSLGSLDGFDGMDDADRAILQIREEGTVSQPRHSLFLFRRAAVP
jgi:hypothetical protein